jgi:hypothetical protein
MPAVTTIIGGAVSVASAGMSFAQAMEQTAKAKAADAAAQKAMDEAKKILDVNVYKGVTVDMLPFNLQREDLAAIGGQAITAAAESGRGASETAGRVLAATQAQDREITAGFSKELSNLNLLAAQEESNLQRQKADIELAEVAGAQQASADAERNMNAAIASGVSSLADFGLTLYGESPLYPKEKRQKPEKTKTMEKNKTQ